METRHGPSISVKMILTTTALIVLTVVGFGLLNIGNIGRVYDENTRDAEAKSREQLRRVGSATVNTLATSARPFLSVNNDADIKSYVTQLAKGDELISFVYVLDPDQKVIAHSDPAKAPKEEAGGHVALSDDSWAAVTAFWQKIKEDPKQQEPLVAGVNWGADTALFAYPVFPEGTSPTVKGAIDPGAEMKPLGYAVIGYTYKYLRKELQALKDKRERAYRSTFLRTMGVGALFMLLGTVFAIFQGLRISRPIKLLAWRAEQIARGDLETRVEVTSTDEVGLLGENFNFMADQLVVLLRQTAEKATMEKELEVARTIQDTLVPSNDVVDRGFVKLAGFFQPATQCGGDWWTYHDLVDGKVLVVIGDVTGHGVPSAMITAAAKAACDVARAVNHDDVDCTQLLEIMNRAIFESAKRAFVMTAFASILDPKTRTITYANAGHNFPYLFRPNGEGGGEFGSLMIRGNRLGDLPDSKYGTKTMELKAGDVLIWYTDGIVECENEKNEEYGEKRFRAAIRRAADKEPAEMRDQVVASAMQFFGERARKDDITMVISRVY